MGIERGLNLLRIESPSGITTVGYLKKETIIMVSYVYYPKVDEVDEFLMVMARCIL